MEAINQLRLRTNFQVIQKIKSVVAAAFRDKKKRRIIILVTLGVLIPVTIFSVLEATRVKADWFDDSYNQRQKVSYSHTSDISAERRISITVNTQALIADGKMQTDCDDTIFTTIGGKLLKYTLVSGCNTTTTVYDVVVDSVTNGGNNIFMYYSNPIAHSTIDGAVSSVTGLTPNGAPSVGSEEIGPSPSMYLKFDEAYGGTAHDSTSNGNNASLGDPTVLDQKLRQEINIIDHIATAAGDDPSIVQLDTTKYSGTVTYFFEVVAQVGSGTLTVALERAGTSTQDSTITVTETAFTRKRSVTAFTPPAGTTEYNINLANGTTPQVKSARILVFQDIGKTALTGTQTQFEIGNYEVGKSNPTASSAPLSSPKYWTYTDANWDGTVTFAAEVSWKKINGTESTQTTYSSGTGNFSSPTAQTITVEAWGGGGGGAGGGGANGDGNGGGAGGQYAAKGVAVSANTNYAYVIGTGGGGGNGGSSGTSGAAGSPTTFASNVVVARGGLGGTWQSGGGGAGGVGSTANGVGTTLYGGGSGGTGSGTTAGGGGGGAGSTGLGNNASGVTPGLGKTEYGGAGGSGIAVNNGVGFVGENYGGGGGSSTRQNAGLAGAGGFMRVTYGQSVSTHTVTIKLQEDNGSFGGWTDKVTIVNAVSGVTTPTRTRSATFNPTDGRHYRVLSYIDNAGSTYDVYNAKIIVNQTSTSALTKLENSYLLANTLLSAGTSLQNFDTLFDPSEIYSQTAAYYHEANAPYSNASSLILQTDPNGTPADIANTTVFLSDRSISSAFSVPSSSQTIDVKATTNNGNVFSSGILSVKTFSSGDPSLPSWVGSADYCVSASCLEFDGLSEVSAVSDNEPINFGKKLNGGFTFQTWVRANTLGESNTGKVFSKGADNFLGLAAGSTSEVADLAAKIDLGTTDATLTIDDGITLNRWHLVSLVYTNDSDDEISIYVDGVLKGTSINGDGSPATETNTLNIGAGSSGSHFDGYIDEFKIYAKERTLTEIQSDNIKYSPTLHGTSAAFGNDSTNFLSDGLEGYWKMDESSGNATDYSGNDYTLFNHEDTVFTLGKFNNGVQFSSSPSQYFSLTPTYYFDGTVTPATDPNSMWDSDSLAFNGNPDDCATITNASSGSDALWAEGTNAPTSGDTILSVQARTLGATNGNPSLPEMYTMVSYSGTTLGWVGTIIDTPAHWGEYSIIDAPSGGWTWTKAHNLAATAIFDSAGNLSPEGVLCQVEIKVNTSSISAPIVRSVSFWVKPDTTTETFLTLRPGAYISASLGTLSATSFANPTIYINGVSGGTLTADVWQLITVTTETAIAADEFNLGGHLGSYYSGMMDEIRLYNRVLSADEVQNLYVWSPNPSGYWKMDENTGVSAYDSSGHDNTGTLSEGASFAPGRYGSGVALDGNNDFVTTPSNSYISPTSSVAVSSWVLMDENFSTSSPNNRGIIDKGDYQLYMDKTDGKAKFSIEDSVSNIFSNIGQGTGVSGPVNAFAVYNGSLYVGGLFTTAGGVTVNNIAKYNDQTNQFSNIGQTTGVDNTVRALAVYNGSLYVGGNFATAGGVSVNYIAKYNDQTNQFSNIGQTTGVLGDVNALAIYNGNLYVGGDFLTAGGVSVNRIAKYNDQTNQFSNIGQTTGVDNTVRALAVYNGSLYVGGLFTTAGGVSVNRIAKYDDQTNTFSNIGQTTGVDSTASTLAVYNGSLYVGGNFATAGGVTVNNIAKYNDQTNQFSNIGQTTGVDSTASTLAVYNGSLYVGGNFATAGGASVNYIAKYGTSNLKTVASTTTSWTAGKWYHLAGTFDGTNLKLYVNGVLEGTTTNGASLFGLSTSDAPLLVGKTYGSQWAGGSDEAFKGTIDEVRIYDYPAEVKQISKDLDAENPAPDSTLGVPIAHWKFDEGGGTTVYDRTGSNRNLTTVPSSPTSQTYTVNGKFNQAFYPNGINYASRDDNTFVFENNSFAISIWFKSNSASNPSGVEYILGRGASGSGTAGYKLSFSSTGQLDFGIEDANHEVDSVGSQTDIYDGLWHHAVAVKKGTESLKLYVDGQLSSENADLIATAVINGDNTLVIGARGEDYAEKFNGSIDEVAIYNYTLGEDEAKILLNDSKTSQWGATSTDSSGNPSNSYDREFCVPGDTATCGAPTGEWKFDESIWINDASTLSVKDSSGNAYHMHSSPAGSGPTGAELGKFGNAGYFDGVDDYLREPTNADLSINAEDFSISGWLYKTTPATTDVVVSKKATTAATDPGYYLYVSSTGLVRFLISDGTDQLQISDPSSIPINQWAHVGVVVDRDSSSNTGIYVNGIKRATTLTCSPCSPTGTIADIGNLNPVTASYFTVGAQPVGNTNYEGKIDNLILYKYARTPQQINWEYNRGEARYSYRFNECSGATANNAGVDGNGTAVGVNLTITPGASGNTTVGTCEGAANEMWYGGSDGKFNGSLDFDGTDDYAASSNTVLFTSATSEPYNNFSFGAWVNPATNPTSDTVIHKNNEFRLTTNASNVPQCEIYYGTWQTAAVASTALPTTTWSHVFCTYDGSNIKIYINGELKGTQAETDSIYSTSATALNIGRDSAGSGYFDGKIDEVTIHSTALNDTLVKLLYNQSSAVKFGQ